MPSLFLNGCLCAWFVSGTSSPWSTSSVFDTQRPFLTTCTAKSSMKPIRSASPQSQSLYVQHLREQSSTQSDVSALNC